MSSYISVNVHFVWSTGGRDPLILREWQDDLYGYCGGILRNKNAKLLCAGGMPDHVHLLTSLPSTVTLAEIVNVVKSNSSKWIHENIQGAKGFHWQQRYGAFGVSKSTVDQVTRYIQDQPNHHRGRTFQEEFRALLDKHGIEYEERYLWT